MAGSPPSPHHDDAVLLVAGAAAEDGEPVCHQISREERMILSQAKSVCGRRSAGVPDADGEKARAKSRCKYIYDEVV